MMNEYDSNYFCGDFEVDNKIMEAFLDDMIIVSGTARNTMLKVKKSIGGSALFGETWRGYLSPTKNRTRSKRFKNLYQTKLMDDHPDMIEVFKEFRDIYFPDFFYTQIMINKNFPCPPHKDSSNVGDSYLISFGDYSGGRTIVHYEEGKEYLNSRLTPITFNGSKYTHEVEPFEGKRYSLVYYNNIKSWQNKLLPGIEL